MFVTEKHRRLFIGRGLAKDFKVVSRNVYAPLLSQESEVVQV